MDQTLVLIKPDAIQKNIIGSIISRFEKEGFIVKGLRMLKLTKEDAMNFYAVHKDKSFYMELVDFMTQDRIVAILLEGEDAVDRVRAIMGATNSRAAADGTLRNLYGTDIQANAVHGSDSKENAVKEINFFFNALERF